MAEKKHVIEYIDIIKSFEKVKEKLKNKSDKGHQHGNADITDIDASKIKSGTIDIDRLPKGAIERMVYVKDDAARFALTTNTAQNGDTVKVRSTKKMFYIIDDTKLSSEAGYEPYTAESASAVPWSGVTGKPTTFTPEAHTHVISEVADLQETLAGLRQDVNAKPNDNTWRDVVDGLDSTRTDASLSANQGRVLNERIDGYLPLHSTADIAASVVDYGDTAKHIQIGFSGAGITGDDIKYIAGYTGGDGGNLSAKIKDISKDALKSWLGLGSRAYDSTDYLPLSGGTITGRIVKNTNGSWVGDRDRAVVYSMYPGDDSYGCVACMPTKNGSWSMGNLGGVEHLIFNYVPDANYSANKNESIHVYLRPTEGTIALTKDIPTSLPASDVYAWAKASSKPSYTASEVGAAAVYDVKEVIPMNSGTSHEIQTDYSSAIIRIGNLCMAMCGITGTIYPRTWYPVAQIPTPNNSKTYFPTKQTNTIICGISGSDHMEAIIDTKGIIKVWWSGSSPVTSANFCIPYYIK